MPASANLGMLDSLRLTLIVGMGVREIEQHYLIAEWLDRESVVVDLGGNVGRFTAVIREEFQCRVVVVEPEAANFEAIPSDGGIVKLRAAVGGRCGTITLDVSASDSTAHIAREDGQGRDGQRVELVEFSTLIERAEVGAVDYLKVDIEGCEWEFFDAMTDAQLAAIPQIAVEFHDFVPEFRERARTWSVYARLRSLGFRCVEDPAFASYNVLFARPKARRTGRSHAFRLRLLDFLLVTKWKLAKLKRLVCC
ncbi:MAG: FkbM family methyltransferase [Chthoniobacteraceae bacterium]